MITPLTLKLYALVVFVVAFYTDPQAACEAGLNLAATMGHNFTGKNLD